MMTEVVVDLGAFVLFAIASVSALLYLAGPKDQPSWPPAGKLKEPESEPVCSCEYVDVLPGVEMLAVPDPECSVHSLEMLAAMTYERHAAERELGIEAVRAHWEHDGCPCGCGGAA